MNKWSLSAATRGGLPWSDTMMVLLATWLCTLPFIAWLVVAVFGIRVGLGVAVALLIGVLIVCWGLCATRLPGGKGRD
jgi:hypothetical protein